MKRRLKIKVTPSSGKDWLQKAKKIAGIIVKTCGFILSAPIKIPSKIAQGLKYLALLAGMISTLQKPDAPVE